MLLSCVGDKVELKAAKESCSWRHSQSLIRLQKGHKAETGVRLDYCIGLACQGQEGCRLIHCRGSLVPINIETNARQLEHHFAKVLGSQAGQNLKLENKAR